MLCRVHAQAVGASERVVAMLGAAPAPQIAAGIIPATFSGRMSLEDVKFRCGQGQGSSKECRCALCREPLSLGAAGGCWGAYGMRAAASLTLMTRC